MKTFSGDQNKLSKKKQKQLLNLPSDLLFEILSWLQINELTTFSRCCRSAHFLCQDDRLWKRYLLTSGIISCSCCLEKINFHKTSGLKFYYLKLMKPHDYQFTDDFPQFIDLTCEKKTKKKNNSNISDNHKNNNNHMNSNNHTNSNNNNNNHINSNNHPNSNNNNNNHMNSNNNNNNHTNSNNNNNNPSNKNEAKVSTSGNDLLLNTIDLSLSSQFISLEKDLFLGNSLWFGRDFLHTNAFPGMEKLQHPLTFDLLILGGRPLAAPLFNILSNTADPRFLYVSKKRATPSNDEVLFRLDVSHSKPREKLTSSLGHSVQDERVKTESFLRRSTSSILKPFWKSGSIDAVPKIEKKRSNSSLLSFWKPDRLSPPPSSESFVFLDILMAIGERLSPFYRKNVLAKAKAFVVVFDTNRQHTFEAAKKQIVDILKLKRIFYGQPHPNHPGIVLVGIDAHYPASEESGVDEPVEWEEVVQYAKKPSPEDHSIPLVRFSAYDFSRNQNLWLALHPFIIAFLEFSKYRHQAIRSGTISELESGLREEVSEWDLE